MNTETINDKRNMNYKYYIKQPMEMIESKLNIIIPKNPPLINSLDRSIKYPLIRKFSKILFNNQKMFVLKITDD